MPSHGQQTGVPEALTQQPVVQQTDPSGLLQQWLGGRQELGVHTHCGPDGVDTHCVPAGQQVVPQQPVLPAGQQVGDAGGPQSPAQHCGPDGVLKHCVPAGQQVVPQQLLPAGQQTPLAQQESPEAQQVVPQHTWVAPQQRPFPQQISPPGQHIVPQASASAQQVPLIQAKPDGQGHALLQAGEGGQEGEEHLYVVFGQ